MRNKLILNTIIFTVILFFTSCKEKKTSVFLEKYTIKKRFCFNDKNKSIVYDVKVGKFRNKNNVTIVYDEKYENNFKDTVKFQGQDVYYRSIKLTKVASKDFLIKNKKIRVDKFFYADKWDIAHELYIYTNKYMGLIFIHSTYFNTYEEYDFVNNKELINSIKTKNDFFNNKLE